MNTKTCLKTLASLEGTGNSTIPHAIRAALPLRGGIVVCGFRGHLRQGFPVFRAHPGPQAAKDLEA